MSDQVRASGFLKWAVDTFGKVALSRTERAARFLEEAMELAHSENLPCETAVKILARTYSRPKGELTREFGQAQVTLEMMAQNANLPLDAMAEAEYKRVVSIPPAEWHRRQAAKVEAGPADQS